MNFTVHTMEYAGGRAETSLDLRNYRDSDYEEYRAMYNGCFLAMRTALGIRPAECCKTREELAQSRSEIWVLERSGVLAGSVAVYGNEIDDLVVKGDFQGRGLGRALLQWALALLEAEGRGPAVLHVADWNRRAMELYRKQGFRIIKTEVIDRTA
ncbi:MAG: GNAT family N-acetyltransferase [Sakamotonia sp.]